MEAKKKLPYKLFTAKVKGTGWPIDGHTVAVALWDYDPTSYHLFGWPDEADEAMMETVWQSEQECGLCLYDDKADFVKAWKNKEYEAPGAFCFNNDNLEGLKNAE